MCNAVFESYFVDVVLPLPLERQFTYRINKEEYEFLKVGMRLAVPFGKSKVYTGLVYKIHKIEPQTYEAKEIHQILEEYPIIIKQQLKTNRK